VKRRQWIKNAWGLGLAWQWGQAQSKPLLQWKQIDFLGLGTHLSIQAGHTDKQTLTQALNAARECVATIEAQMSLFNDQSALCRLNREGVLHHPPAHLLTVMKAAQHYARESDGAFDVTVQPLWKLFDRAQSQGHLPSAAQVHEAQRLVSWKSLSVSSEQIGFKQTGMSATLNGIAQGYASDQVRGVLQSFGVAHALVNMGEWSAMGQSPRNSEWLVGLAAPESLLRSSALTQDAKNKLAPSDQLIAKLHLSGACVATSADDQSSFSKDFVHHHIFDPHTGYSPRDVASVSVVADSCIKADALTKVLFVAGYEQALNVAKQWNVQALVVNKSGEYKMTKGLPVV
jgi:FAD:protein FMN transferase